MEFQDLLFFFLFIFKFFMLFYFYFFSFFPLCDGDLSILVHCYLLGNTCEGDEFDGSQIWWHD